MYSNIFKQFTLFLLLCCFYPIFTASWRVFFYMDSSEELSHMAIKNITDMIRANPKNTIEFFIQLHAYHDVALRYQVTQEGLTFLEEVLLTGNAQQDFIEASRWGFANAKVDHTMLIMSDHGWGILDPAWNEKTERWEIKQDGLNECCVVKRSFLSSLHENHKGFLFNNSSHTYLTNSELVAGLHEIKTSILHDTLLDVIAFDTCMGSMLEVAYQLVPFARYLVGCQTCALADGFDYQEIISLLNNKHNDVLSIVCGMVSSFDDYYKAHDESGIYTHSALDLSQVKLVVDALDNVIKQIYTLPMYEKLLHEVRAESTRFCLWPMYTDTLEFFKILRKKLLHEEQSDEVVASVRAIEQLCKAHDQMIVAHCAGFKTNRLTHGSAIYCPYNYIDSSYPKTLFANSCQWIQLLNILCLNAVIDEDNLPEWSVS